MVSVRLDGEQIPPCSVTWRVSAPGGSYMAPRKAAAIPRMSPLHLPRVSRGAGCSSFHGPHGADFGFGPGSPEDQGEVAPCVCRIVITRCPPPCPVQEVGTPVLRARRSLTGQRTTWSARCAAAVFRSAALSVHQVRSMGRTTASFRAGRVPEDRYRAQAERFWRQLGNEPGRPTAPGSGPARILTSPVRLTPSPLMTARRGSRRLHELAQLHGQGLPLRRCVCGRQATRPGTGKHRSPPGPAAPAPPPAS